MFKKNIVQNHITKLQYLLDSVQWEDGLKGMQKEIILDQIRLLFLEIQKGEVQITNEIESEVKVPKILQAPVRPTEPISAPNVTRTETKSEVNTQDVEKNVAKVALDISDEIDLSNPIVDIHEVVIKSAPSEIAMESSNLIVESDIEINPVQNQNIDVNRNIQMDEDINRESINNGQFAALFEISTGKELSNVLSNLPVEDISSAMSLNERVQYISGLFNGSSYDFESAIIAINNSLQFDQAKDYIVNNLVEKYNWMSEEKSSKAKQFIKLVRRKFANS